MSSNHRTCAILSLSVELRCVYSLYTFNCALQLLVLVLTLHTLLTLSHKVGVSKMVLTFSILKGFCLINSYRLPDTPPQPPPPPYQLSLSLSPLDPHPSSISLSSSVILSIRQLYVPTYKLYIIVLIHKLCSLTTHCNYGFSKRYFYDGILIVVSRLTGKSKICIVSYFSR